jgi:hypothetical protein
MTGRAADRAAKATGMARRTLEKAEAIVDAAEVEPKKYGKLLDEMDRTGRVNGAYRRLKVARQAEGILTWAKDKMGMVTGCAARPSTASWRCAASQW